MPPLENLLFIFKYAKNTQYWTIFQKHYAFLAKSYHFGSFFVSNVAIMDINSTFFQHTDIHEIALFINIGNQEAISCIFNVFIFIDIIHCAMN